MADDKDPLAARRWFRQRLATLGALCPHLKRPEAQARLSTALDNHTEEEPQWQESLQEIPEAAPKAQASSAHKRA